MVRILELSLLGWVGSLVGKLKIPQATRHRERKKKKLTKVPALQKSIL